MDTIAVVLTEPEALGLDRLALTLPGEEDVVVDVEWSGVSTGTERLLWSGRMPPFPGMGYPLVPGYESVGRIASVGSRVQVRVGDRVFVPGANCFGPVRGLFGGAAARLVVPGARVTPIGDDLGEQGILLALAATAYHAAPAHASQPDLIVGHGVLGRLLAHQLSAAGHRVEVFDPARCDGPPAASGARAAGWTAAGMLSPVAELERAGPEVFALGLRSCTLWPGIVAGLANPPSLHMRGSLLLAHRGDAGAAMRIVNLLQARAEAAYLPHSLSRAELSGMEPAVHGPSLAWLLPCEGQIDAVRAMQALAGQASAQGTRWHWGRRVTDLQAGLMSIESDGARAQQRFDHVFDVRGTGAQPDLPVRGVRGEVIWLHAPGVVLQRPIRLMHPRQPVYLVPRPGDLVVVGASEIESEDRSPISLRSTLELLSAAHSVLPELAEARIVHTETNLRPALPDNLPLLQHAHGLTRINGLYRHGWLIAPALVEQALQALQLHTADLQHHA